MTTHFFAILAIAMQNPAANPYLRDEICGVSQTEQKEVDETGARLAEPIPYHRLYDVYGCGIVSLYVSKDGVVKSARIRRQAMAGGVAWHSLAMHLSFKKQPTDWQGLIRFRISREAIDTPAQTD